MMTNHLYSNEELTKQEDVDANVCINNTLFFKFVFYFFSIFLFMNLLVELRSDLSDVCNCLLLLLFYMHCNGLLLLGK